MSDVISNADKVYFVVIHTPTGRVPLEVPMGCYLASSDTVDIFETIAEANVAANAGVLRDHYLELPEEGEVVTVGYWKYQNQIVYCHQEHNRTIYAPEDTPALFYFYRPNPEGMEWIAQESVSIGATRTWNGLTYECLQAHVTLYGMEPDVTPALWVVVSTSNVWSVGIQVTVGEQYWYPDEQGTLYVVLQSHTTQAGWIPPAVPALWAVV
jgi:hypothetical protein